MKGKAVIDSTDRIRKQQPGPATIVPQILPSSDFFEAVSLQSINLSFDRAADEYSSGYIRLSGDAKFPTQPASRRYL
jgi:hypothetical protein